MKLKINIVGLTHNDVKQDSMEYARSAEGNQLKLLSDKQNAYDPMAVKVYDGSLFVGYVVHVAVLTVEVWLLWCAVVSWTANVFDSVFQIVRATF